MFAPSDITVTILDIIPRPVFYLKYNVSETILSHLVPTNTETSSVDWAQLSTYHLKTEK
jgi:hypothetical protein